jgi:hypothetical protein
MARHVRKPSGSLVFVGVGIGGVHQITPEAAAHIRRADRVFYLVLDPITETWLRSVNHHSMSLSDLYAVGKSRRQTYRQMTTRIVTAVKAGARVCVAFYGHPGVFVQATSTAVRSVRRLGAAARVVPAISADGCLYADLGLDPSVSGIQAFEATDFLLYRRRIDPTSSLLLWQIGVLGETTTRDPRLPYRSDRMRVLVRRLRRHFPRGHPAVLYEASTFPSRPPIIRRVRLEALADTQIRPLMTLYVPALSNRAPDPRVVNWLRQEKAGSRAVVAQATQLARADSPHSSPRRYYLGPKR